MIDMLSIERIWEDDYYFQIEVVAQSKLISARVKSYTTEDRIEELASRLKTFPEHLDDKYIWENGGKGEGYTPFVSLEFWCKNKSGHINIEVYMEIDDGASYDKHNCCFFINTEPGLLNDFGKSLVRLTQKGIGKKITLSTSET